MASKNQSIVYQSILTFIGVVAYYFIKPLTLIYTVLLQPIFLYQIVIFIKYHSWQSFAMLIIGYIVGMLFASVIFAMHRFSRYIILLGGYLTPFKDLSYKEQNIQEFIKCTTNGKDSEEIETNIINAAKKERDYSIFGFKADEFLVNTHIYHVTKDSAVKDSTTKDSSSSVKPNVFATYAGNTLAYIFITEDPKNLTSFQKFAVLHEIGHTLRRSGYLRYVLSLKTKLFIIFIIWFLCFSVLEKEQITLFILLLVSIIPLTQEIYAREKNFKLADETEADMFGLKHVSYEDLKIVAKVFAAESSAVRPKVLDRSLTEEQNWLRVKYIEKNIKLLSNKEELIAHEVDPLLSTPLSIIMPFILIILLAASSLEPTWTQVFYSLILLFILLIFNCFGLILNLLMSITVDTVIEKEKNKNSFTHNFCKEVIEFVRATVIYS